MTISGGSVGRFNANPESKVTITGGTVGGRRFYVSAGSEVTIAGGTVGRLLVRQDRSGNNGITISGGEFRLSGVAPAGPTVTLDAGDILTGTLEDGSPFIFSAGELNGVGVTTLASAPLPTLVTTPIVVDSTGGPSGLREGQMLTLLEGGVLDENFAAVNASLNIEAGTVGERLEIAGSDVTISGGTVGDYFTAFPNSDVRVSGGEIASGDVAISGGTIGSSVVDSGDVVISGGTISSVSVFYDSVVNILGGEIGGRYFQANDGTQVNIFGTEFKLDGVEMPKAMLGEALMISARDAELAGVLADGSTFSLGLNIPPTPSGGDDYFSPDATLTVTLISLLDGDYNSNGVVEQSDLDLVLLNWGEEVFNPHGAGWINDIPSGIIDQEELDKVLLGWGNSVDGVGAVGVPEPSAVCLALVAGAAFIVARRRT